VAAMMGIEVSASFCEPESRPYSAWPLNNELFRPKNLRG
jgi:hypothetical protein